MITKLIILAWVHWAADFFLQNDEMAVNKSSSNYYLGLHCFIYSLCLLPYGIMFSIINGAMHFIIDYMSSRITARYWQRGERHNFFVAIGADQAIHMSILVFTAFKLGII